MNVTHKLNRRGNKVQELLFLKRHLFHMVGEGGSTFGSMIILTPKSVFLTISSIWPREYIHCLRHGIMLDRDTVACWEGKELEYGAGPDSRAEAEILAKWVWSCCFRFSAVSTSAAIQGREDLSCPGPPWSRTPREVMGMLLCRKEGCCSETLRWRAYRNLSHSLQDWNPSCFREQLIPWYGRDRTEHAL